MNDILQTEKLTKRFSSVLAVDSLSFALRQGSITALLGGNGAGKTTTLSMLLGLLEPTSGKISLFGQDFMNYIAMNYGRFPLQHRPQCMARKFESVSLVKCQHMVRIILWRKYFTT